MEYRHLIFGKESGVATITLNRPEVLNALNNRLRYEICMALQECDDDTDVRVVVLKGEGRAFCPGDDLTSPPDPAPPSQRRGPGDVAVALRNLPKPIITQVHGYAYGAGFEIVMGADFCIAAEGTRFASPFVKRAIGWGGNMLPRFVGMRRATEMLLTGEPIEAQQAAEWGLINRVVPAERLEAEVAAWAGRFAAAATVAVGVVKGNLTRGWEPEHGGRLRHARPRKRQGAAGPGCGRGAGRLPREAGALLHRALRPLRGPLEAPEGGASRRPRRGPEVTVSRRAGCGSSPATGWPWSCSTMRATFRPSRTL